MSRTPLIAALRADSAATERGRARQRMGQAHDSVVKEIRGEQATSMGRAGRKLSEAIEAARVALAEHDAEPSEEGLERYRALRAVAVRARWEIRVQRECMGLLNHDDVDEHYPLPPKR